MIATEERRIFEPRVYICLSYGPMRLVAHFRHRKYAFQTQQPAESPDIESYTEPSSAIQTKPWPTPPIPLCVSNRHRLPAEWRGIGSAAEDVHESRHGI